MSGLEWRRLFALAGVTASIVFALCVVLAAVLGEFNRVAISNLAIAAAVVLVLASVVSGGLVGRYMPALGHGQLDGTAYTHTLHDEMLLTEEFRSGRLHRGARERLGRSAVMFLAAVCLSVTAFLLA